MIAAALLFYSWVRSQIVNTGYESQSLFAVKESLLRTQTQLILEEDTLRNPETYRPHRSQRSGHGSAASQSIHPVAVPGCGSQPFECHGDGRVQSEHEGAGNKSFGVRPRRLMSMDNGLVIED